VNSQNRRRWTVREASHHRSDPIGEHTVSEVCRRHGIAVGQFYTWEKQARQGALEVAVYVRQLKSDPLDNRKVIPVGGW
jgi:transposase-like protein